MKTALIISTYNKPDYLRLCLATAFAQTVMPDEIIIADDGSGQETREVVEAFRQHSSTPITHVWHEDSGFRLSAIRNKAIAAATADYIIQIDDDILLDRHFVEDHLAVCEEGYWCSGSRVFLTEGITRSIITKGKTLKPGHRIDVAGLLSRRKMESGHLLNSIRIPLVRNYLRKRYAIKKVDHLRGCNMAYFRKDAILANGYNEDLTSWGHEDGEFAYRLHFNGIRKQSLKMGGIEYHMYHKQSSRSNEQLHLDTIDRLKREKTKRCTNGIDKYL